MIHADHLNYLKNMPDKSVDVVYFDPMFRQMTKTVALAPLRTVANSSPLKLEAMLESRRVARKTVVLREHFNSGEFERLGFKVDRKKPNSKFDYGIINLNQ